MNEENKQIDMIKSVYNDKVAEINGREYHITKINHAKRLKVFSYYTSIKDQLLMGNFAFLDTSKWREVEKVIDDIVLFENSQISKLNKHWEEYPEDYMIYVSTMLNVISYPFFRSSLTN